MIKKLKIRFIVLAMVSLTVLLSVIVAGMNIANYRNVVSDADKRIEVLEENSSRLLDMRENMGAVPPPGGFEDLNDPEDLDDAEGEPDDRYDPEDRDDGRYFGRDGMRGPSMTRDEAEESRFFVVALGSEGNVEWTNVDRISSVDSSKAGEMAKQAASSNDERGFIGDFRYSVDEEGSETRVTFLDCGRTLSDFRDFLKASVLMSLAGLIAVFFVILYFAGRIVKPVAESYEKQKHFITDAGHEIKTPLAIIKANIDLMGMELDGEDIDRGELKESLGDVNDQVDRLAGLTNDLVYLSRMEEAGDSLVMTDVPVSDIVAETVSSFEALAAEKGLAICPDIEPMISIRGSSKELEKLVSILMDNAIKYSEPPRVIELNGVEDGMPAPPEISVDFRKEGRNAVLKVANRTEAELSNEALSHVFERFYRTDSSRNSQTGGHGIGLSMASAIVKAHGGDISARTTDSHDFIVTAVLPL